MQVSNTTSDSIFEEEPVHLVSYCLPAVEVKMFRMNEFTYVVMQTDKVKEIAKCLVCISKEHADYVFDACVEKVKPWVN